ARTNNVPYLGICFGMQLALIEFAINALGLKDATSKELNPNTQLPLIDLKNNGNSMRLGLYSCELLPGSKAHEIYGQDVIYERHRHRYEFNNKYADLFQESELVFSGRNNEEGIVEIIELKNHPFFVACQFHPEFLSRPNREHPLFSGFIKAVKSQSK
ncbi:MAG TPA: gamma-glutamyl-gamma-aminobutyrate hydrolase family protein, partial [Bacilli bacterium]